MILLKMRLLVVLLKQRLVDCITYFTVFTLIVNWSNLKVLVHENAL